jgi:hypothetical protein
MKTQKQNGRRCNAGRHEQKPRREAKHRPMNATPPLYRKPIDVLEHVRRLAAQQAARARCVPEEGGPVA